jgi:hypothetical protein
MISFRFFLFFFISICLFLCLCWNSYAYRKETNDEIPDNVIKLMKYYPQIVNYKNNTLFFANGKKLVYDDGITNKSNAQLLNKADVEDQFYFQYKIGKSSNTISPYFDPGRIRNEDFFKCVYGDTKKEVESKLVKIVWCPKLVNQSILVTSVNSVDKKLLAISNEFDKMPQYKNYFEGIGGTFNWRMINGTNRLSMHSFGMTIDLNSKHSNYWQWGCKCTNEDSKLNYKNKIPQEIVDVFERYGFIWGGKWYHYDTMHFEYRPELIFD